MQKKYTYPIPDDLYVNKFDGEKVYSGTYNGPETLHLLVQEGMPVTIWSDAPITSEYDKVNMQEITLDASAFPEVADYVTSLTKEFTPTFKTITNIDGSTHEELSNPRLKDYYTLYYIDGARPWDFRLITRDLTFGAEEKVEKDLAYVKSFRDKYDFGSDNAIIDGYIANAESYIATVKPLYPWRFEKPLTSPVEPKIPISLVTLFKSVGE